MRQMKLILFSLIILSFVSCSSLKDHAKYGLHDGFYNSSGNVVYSSLQEDTLKIFEAGYLAKQKAITDKNSFQTFPSRSGSLPSSIKLKKNSFDLDVLTIPFKYRPRRPSLSNQLTTNFNGAVYIGHRSDIYKVFYEPVPLGGHTRKINHFGYSIGLFSGIGAAAMNPWVTQYQINDEYESVVFSKGISAIIGFNNVSFGIGLGNDHMIDKNKKLWIYQGKPWLGLIVGLNLN
jgi:hypothetical protein